MDQNVGHRVCRFLRLFFLGARAERFLVSHGRGDATLCGTV